MPPSNLLKLTVSFLELLLAVLFNNLSFMRKLQQLFIKTKSQIFALRSKSMYLNSYEYNYMFKIIVL